MPKHPGGRYRINEQWYIKNSESYDYLFIPEKIVQKKIREGWVLVSKQDFKISREEWLKKGKDEGWKTN